MLLHRLANRNLINCTQLELNAITELSSNCVEFRGLWLGQVRQSKLILLFNPSLYAIELMRAEELIELVQYRNLYLQVARQFILEHLKQK